MHAILSFLLSLNVITTESRSNGFPDITLTLQLISFKYNLPIKVILNKLRHKAIRPSIRPIVMDSLILLLLNKEFWSKDIEQRLFLILQFPVLYTIPYLSDMNDNLPIILASNQWFMLFITFQL
jgi:hypothetical protein